MQFEWIVIAATAFWMMTLAHANAADAGTAEAVVSLVQDGKTSAVIIAAEDQTEEGKSAIDDLVNYVQQSTGAVLSKDSASVNGRLELHIGPTDYVESLNLSLEDLDLDGFRILFPDPDRIVLIGNTSRGTEYAIYEFIERYVGVRWLFPGELGTYVPETRNLDIPSTEVISKPTFISRTISNMQSVDRGQPIGVWLQRQRRHWTISHHHNLDKLFPPEQYVASHPEFFAVINGKRVIPKAGDQSWQPVLHADGIVDEAVRNINRYFDENPDKTSYSLGINDNNTFDFPATRKNSVGLDDYSDYYFRYANAVADGVMKKHPDKWLGCLAYVGITDPPRETGVHPRIVPHICIDRQSWASEEHALRDMQRTKDWHKVAPMLGWYDYIYGDDHYRIPRIYPHLMGRYLKFAAANGVKAYYAEYYGSPAWPEGPKMYVLMKLLWNADQDVDAMLEEWYRLAVGEKAAASLAKYYEFWEDYWMKRVVKTDWFKQNADRVYMDFDRIGYLDQLTPDDLIEARRLMAEVEKLAETPLQKQRAAFFAKSLADLLHDIDYYIALNNAPETPVVTISTIFSDTFQATDKTNDAIPQPWGGWQNEPGTARLYRHQKVGYQDSQSLSLDAAGGIGNAVFYRDEKVSDNNTLYHFSTMLQSNQVNPDADLGIEIRWRRADGQYLPRKYTANKFYRAGDLKNGEWTQVELLCRPPDLNEPLVMTVYLATSYAREGIVRFDDAKLETVSVAKP